MPQKQGGEVQDALRHFVQLPDSELPVAVNLPSICSEGLTRRNIGDKHFDNKHWVDFHSFVPVDKAASRITNIGVRSILPLFALRLLYL